MIRPPPFPQKRWITSLYWNIAQYVLLKVIFNGLRIFLCVITAILFQKNIICGSWFISLLTMLWYKYTATGYSGPILLTKRKKSDVNVTPYQTATILYVSLKTIVPATPLVAWTELELMTNSLLGEVTNVNKDREFKVTVYLSIVIKPLKTRKWRLHFNFHVYLFSWWPNFKLYMLSIGVDNDLSMPLLYPIGLVCKLELSRFSVSSLMKDRMNKTKIK